VQGAKISDMTTKRGIFYYKIHIAYSVKMDIRRRFLDYFQERRHLIMPSSSLIPKNDPSVLLTTAGMQQFKPYYLGTEEPPETRIATVQKCFRTSDIESVGYTDRHLTFFEMLGNFSFGDYFKKEAIALAIDFCVNCLDLPREKLFTAVFSGDKDIPADEESIQYWLDNGINKDRIYRLGREENFWGPAGSSGPCGPCTEIYFDYGPGTGCGRKDCDPSCECGRFLEIWNLVFTQYNFDGKSYTELPRKNIDTGMGLERITAVLEGQASVFMTSLFKPILERIYEITGSKLEDLENDGDTGRSLRILADHCRAIYFLLADGVTPSNEGRGYILRRIIRRAVRFGKKLGIRDFFLNSIGEVVIRGYSGYYDELSREKNLAFEIVLDEEKRFTRTLNEGNSILNGMIQAAKDKKSSSLDPEDAFRLYETYGFPVELTNEILREQGMDLDQGEYDKYFKKHIERSKKKTSFDKKVDENLPLYKDIQKSGKTDFLGYEKEELETEVEAIIRLSGSGRGQAADELNAGEKGEIILKSTVFYGEKGGQSGDRGLIRSEGAIFIVDDTRIPLEDLFIHHGSVKEGRISRGDKVHIEIDRRRRSHIRKNHTSTHLLHWALRNTLGDQARQAGSMVTDNRLRFDYTIYSPPDEDQLSRIEKLVNQKIMKNDRVRCFETTLDYARELDAVALFDEKYGKFVRVVEIDDYNRELCGGTHADRTGEIGIFKIISDTSIGANLRRIEAVTGMHAYEMLNEKEKRLNGISAILEVAEEKAADSAARLKQENLELRQELEELRTGMAAERIIKVLEKREPVNGINIFDFNMVSLGLSQEIPVKDMGAVADRIKDAYGNKNTFIVLGNIFRSKPVMVLSCTPDISGSSMHCGKLAKEVGRIIKGGGGGRPDFAQLGGSDKDSLEKAIDLAVKKARESFTRES
jgi:alanyl-tRNA synthetase